MRVLHATAAVPGLLRGLLALAAVVCVPAPDGALRAAPRGMVQSTPVQSIAAGAVLSDGQFVYGPNAEAFNLADYLKANAPHLAALAEDLYGRAKYFSINPRVYLTILEVRSRLISAPGAAAMNDPLGLGSGTFVSQVDVLSNRMTEAFYSHRALYSSVPVSERAIPPIPTRDGVSIPVPPDTNAGTYALIAGLAAIGQPDIAQVLDAEQPNGFYRTYVRLFADDDPRDDRNQLRPLVDMAAPSGLLQLPYLRGLTWRFGGVHNTGGGTTFTDASALDFFPSGSTWGIDTSGMWVVAAASGVPRKVSACYFEVAHGGGWETMYYHLENIQAYAGFIGQNDKIGVIANTLAEATCSGGAASGPHVHFALKYNGAYVSIDGTALAGWVVHAGRWSYDTDPLYMWFDRAGTRKYPNTSPLLSEGPPTAADVSPAWGPLAGGTVVTITGTDFVVGQTSVTFDGLAATNVQVAGTTSLTAVVPSHPAGSVDVVVATPVGSATLPEGFTYVAPLAPFTDDPLTARATPVRVVHIVELRQAIDALRARSRLGATTWTDPTIVPGVTPVRAAHLVELRAALGQVYVAAGRSAPTYADPSILARTTTITAAQIAELRAAIAAIW
jgi:murein DD-endopeptidase MepM/ murein hydrolase activator NlpD